MKNSVYNYTMKQMTLHLKSFGFSVVPVSLHFVREPAQQGYPGSKGRKTVVHSFSENRFIE